METVHVDVLSERFTVTVLCGTLLASAARRLMVEGVTLSVAGFEGGPANVTVNSSDAPSFRPTKIVLLAGGVMFPKQSVPCNPLQASRRVVPNMDGILLVKFRPPTKRPFIRLTPYPPKSSTLTWTAHWQEG